MVSASSREIKEAPAVFARGGRLETRQRPAALATGLAKLAPPLYLLVPPPCAAARRLPIDSQV